MIYICMARSLVEAALSNTVVEDSDTVMYEVVEEGTTRKRKKLVSSDGFSYCVKAGKMFKFCFKILQYVSFISCR